MKNYSPLLLLSALAIITTVSSCNKQPHENQSKVIQNLSDGNEVMTNPDKFAWQLFVDLNKPSETNRSITVWETWALAKCVFDNPDEAPIWENVSSRDLSELEELPLQQMLRKSQGKTMKFDPDAPTKNETRMNKTTFDFIVQNELYNAEGLEYFYNKNKKIDLDPDAKEIKASWKELTNSNDTNRYYYAVGKDNKIYGLTGFHIITKDIPNWFWSTFEHVDNLEESEEYKNNKKLLASKDNFGFDSQGNISQELEEMFKEENLSNKWKNYRLRGTQTSYVDAMGKPIVLANSKIETKFMITSSCISCHAKASVGALPSNFKPSPLNNYHRLTIFLHDDGSDTSQGNVGSVDPSLFYKEYEEYEADTLIETSKPKFIQTDFMWSFFRAKRKGDTTRSCK